MKKVMLTLVMGFALVVSISSCSKCKVCTYPASSGNPTQEYCEGDGLAEDVFQAACVAGGGTITTE